MCLHETFPIILFSTFLFSAFTNACPELRRLPQFMCQVYSNGTNCFNQFYEGIIKFCYIYLFIHNSKETTIHN